MTTPEENGQGDSALRELFFEAMKLAGAAIALADDYSGGESETAQHLTKEYDKLNSKFDLAIDKIKPHCHKFPEIKFTGEPWHGLTAPWIDPENE